MAPSGGEVRIVDAAALSTAVSTLTVGLKSFGDNTRQMEGICNSFQVKILLLKEVFVLQETFTVLETILSAVRCTEGMLRRGSA
jgi:hypothetical protein